MSNPVSPAGVEATPATPAPAVSVPATPPSGPNVFGIIALALAVLGFVAGILPFASGLAWVLFAPAIVLAIIGLTRRGRPKGMALAGLIVAVAGWIVAIIVTVVSVFTGIGAAVDDFDPVPEATASAEDVVALGQPVTNGDGVTFTLDAVECGLTSSGSEFFDETPAGEFCRLDFTVANGGTESVSLLAGDITAYAGDVAFQADDATGRFGEDYFTTDVNPGLSVPCVVFVDVPAGTALDTVAFAPVLSFTDPVASSAG